MTWMINPPNWDHVICSMPYNNEINKGLTVSRQRPSCPQESSCPAYDMCIWLIYIPRESFSIILYIAKVRFLFFFFYNDKHMFCYFFPILLSLILWFPWVSTCYYEDYWSKLKCSLSSRVWFADITYWHYGLRFVYWPFIAVSIYDI